MSKPSKLYLAGMRQAFEKSQREFVAELQQAGINPNEFFKKTEREQINIMLKLKKK